MLSMVPGRSWGEPLLLLLKMQTSSLTVPCRTNAELFSLLAFFCKSKNFLGISFSWKKQMPMQIFAKSTAVKSELWKVWTPFQIYGYRYFCQSTASLFIIFKRFFSGQMFIFWWDQFFQIFLAFGIILRILCLTWSWRPCRCPFMGFWKNIWNFIFYV